jgi:hypothetical protein
MAGCLAAFILRRIDDGSVKVDANAGRCVLHVLGEFENSKALVCVLHSCAFLHVKCGSQLGVLSGTDFASGRKIESQIGEVMACKCGSENQKLFPADVKLYFDQARTEAPPVFFPDILVCLDCGLSEFRIPGGWNELKAFRRASAE